MVPGEESIPLCIVIDARRYEHRCTVHRQWCKEKRAPVHHQWRWDREMEASVCQEKAVAMSGPPLEVLYTAYSFD